MILKSSHTLGSVVKSDAKNILIGLAMNYIRTWFGYYQCERSMIQVVRPQLISRLSIEHSKWRYFVRRIVLKGYLSVDLL